MKRKAKDHTTAHAARETDASSRGETAEVGRLLYELYVRLGFCLPPDEQARLEETLPLDADAFTDAVLLAEGLDPQQTDSELRNQVRECVARHLQGPSPTGERADRPADRTEP
jgi:hypothetical protein